MSGRFLLQVSMHPSTYVQDRIPTIILSTQENSAQKINSVQILIYLSRAICSTMLAAFCCRNCLLSVRILFTWFIVPRRKRHSRKSFAVNVEWITHGKKWIYSIPLFVHSLHLPLFNKYLLVQMYVGTSKGTCT